MLAKTHESNIRVRRKALRDKDFDEINERELNGYTNTRAHYGKTKYAYTIGQLKRTHCGQCQDNVAAIDSIA